MQQFDARASKHAWLVAGLLGVLVEWMFAIGVRRDLSLYRALGLSSTRQWAMAQLSTVVVLSTATSWAFALGIFLTPRLERSSEITVLLGTTAGTAALIVMAAPVATIRLGRAGIVRQLKD